jgi:hypothetical protein
MQKALRRLRSVYTSTTEPGNHREEILLLLQKMLPTAASHLRAYNAAGITIFMQVLQDVGAKPQDFLIETVTQIALEKCVPRQSHGFLIIVRILHA